MCGNVDILPPAPVVALPAPDMAAQLDALFADFEPHFMDVTHTLANGVYTRTGHGLPGEIWIGAVHKARNILHLFKGKIAVWDTVRGFHVMTAPHSEISPPGIRRIGIILEEVEGANIFETTAENWEQAEAELAEPMTVPANIGQKLLDLAAFANTTLRLG